MSAPAVTADGLPVDGSIPLCIGLVGHRDLRPEDGPLLRQRLGEVLGRIRLWYPHTPLLLLTSLAGGADLLGAEVAADLGWEIVALLPFPPSASELELETDSDRRLFRAVLARALRVVIVPEPETPAPGGARDARDLAFARSGAYLVQHAQLLIALWDGRETSHVAGTARCVDFCLRGIPDACATQLRPLAPRDTGTVIHLQTPRQSQPAPSAPAAYRESDGLWSIPLAAPPGEEPAADAWTRQRRITARIDAFNRALRCGDAALRHSARRSADALLDPAPVASRAAASFGWADALAMRCQRRLHRHLAWLFLFALAAVMAVQIPDDLAGPRAKLQLYLGLLLAAAALFMFSRRSGCEDDYLDCRSLAEGLRVQFYWRAAGLAEEVSDDYLRKQDGELDWIRHALRNVALLEPAGLDPAALARIRLAWLSGEAAYFGEPGRSGKANANLRSAVRLSRLARGAYALAMVLAISQLLLPTQPLLVALMSLGPSIYSLVALYAEKRCLAEHAREYAQSGLLFRLADQRVAEALAAEAGGGAKIEEARTLLREIGRLALEENGDWLLMHRKRPAEFIPV